MSPQNSGERHGSMLRAWQLALLRFAVTLHDADRMNVLAIAKEIDRAGREPKTAGDFGFFRRTSGELCMAILRQNDSADAVLRQYLARIGDARVKRAFASAVEMDDRQAHPAGKLRHDDRLWRGLSPRHSVPSRAR